MKTKIFFFIGIILIGVGVLVSQSDVKIRLNKQKVSEVSAQNIRYYIGGGLAALGLFFSVAGFVELARRSKQTKQMQQIVKYGVATDATITFVDKNYTLLLNKKPIYSMVEYTYTDKNGQQHTRRINKLNSDMVIHKQLQVGKKVSVKYNADKPSESVIVL